MLEDSKSETALKNSASYKIFLEILQGLYEGRYVPGQRLIEMDLMDEFKATRFVVKDALKLLVLEGVAINNFHRSCHIPRLAREEAIHILEVMECLFGLAARQAALSSNLDEFAPVLREACAGLHALSGDVEYFEFGRASSQYFRVIVKISGNTELMRILPSLRVHLVRVQFKAFASVSDRKYVSKFDRIANAVIARDPDAAEALMREYFQTMMENMQTLPDRAFASR